MRRAITFIIVCVLAAAAVATATPSANAVPRWAPASRATIHPGVRTFTSGIQCSASFVFYDAHAVYLGQAEHCSGPLGTPVEIEGASRRGKVVYSSRLTRARAGAERRDTPRQRLRFALVRIHNVDRGRVNLSVPFWGGPAADGGRFPVSRLRTVTNSTHMFWACSNR